MALTVYYCLLKPFFLGRFLLNVNVFYCKPTCDKTGHFLQVCGVLNAIASVAHIAGHLGEGQQLAAIVLKSVVDAHEASIVGEIAEFSSEPFLRAIQLACVQERGQSVDLLSHPRDTAKHIRTVSRAAGGRRAEHREAGVGTRRQARVVFRNLSKRLDMERLFRVDSYSI